MDYKVFPQMNTLVRIQESTLLSDGQRQELARTTGVEGFYKALLSSGFFHYAKPAIPGDLTAAFEEEFQGWLGWAEQITPDARIPAIFKLPFIVHNMSTFLKERLLSRELPTLYFENTGYSSLGLAAIMDTKTPGSAREESMRAVLEDAVADYALHQSFSRIALILKFFYHAALTEISDAIGDSQISSFIEALIDLDLLSVLIQQREGEQPLSTSLLQKGAKGPGRSRIFPLLYRSAAEQDAALLLTPYASIWQRSCGERALGLFDTYADHYLAALCKKAKLEAFGLYPLLAFLFAKLSEIKNVQLLATAKQIGAGPEEIAERLRMGYEL